AHDSASMRATQATSRSSVASLHAVNARSVQSDAAAPEHGASPALEQTKSEAPAGPASRPPPAPAARAQPPRGQVVVAEPDGVTTTAAGAHALAPMDTPMPKTDSMARTAIPGRLRIMRIASEGCHRRRACALTGAQSIDGAHDDGIRGPARLRALRTGARAAPRGGRDRAPRLRRARRCPGGVSRGGGPRADGGRDARDRRGPGTLHARGPARAPAAPRAGAGRPRRREREGPPRGRLRRGARRFVPVVRDPPALRTAQPRARRAAA